MAPSPRMLASIAAAAVCAPLLAGTAVAEPPPGILPGWPVAGGVSVDAGQNAQVLLVRRAGQVLVVARDGRTRRIIRLPSPGPVTPGPAGVVYTVGQADDRVAAVSPTGRVLWRTAGLNVGREASEKGVVVAPDGRTLYVPGTDSLTALEPNGRVRWSAIGLGETAPSTTAVGADGTLYAVATGGGPNSLVVRAADGTARYTKPLVSGGPVAVAPDGTAYVGQVRSLLAVAPDGATRFTLPLPGWPAGLALLPDGRVVASVGGTLWCVTPQGVTCWTLPVRSGLGRPVVAADGTILVPARERLLAVRPRGVIRWSWPVAVGAPTTPVIGGDGTLYTTSGEVLFALRPPGRPVASAPMAALPATFRSEGVEPVCTGPVGHAACSPATPLGTIVRLRVPRAGVVRMAVRSGSRVVGSTSTVRVRAGVAYLRFSGRVNVRVGRIGVVGRLLAPGCYRLDAVITAGATRTRREVAIRVVPATAQARPVG